MSVRWTKTRGGGHRDGTRVCNDPQRSTDTLADGVSAALSEFHVLIQKAVESGIIFTRGRVFLTEPTEQLDANGASDQLTSGSTNDE